MSFGSDESSSQANWQKKTMMINAFIKYFILLSLWMKKILVVLCNLKKIRFLQQTVALIVFSIISIITTVATHTYLQLYLAFYFRNGKALIASASINEHPINNHL